MSGINLLDYITADGVADDTTGFRNAVTAASAAGLNPLGMPKGELRCDAGHSIRITDKIAVNSPLRIRCESLITYHGTAGDALVIGDSAPSQGNQYYDLEFAGFYNDNGNTGQPNTCNSSGTTGLRVNSMCFSRVKVGLIQGFTKYGSYFDGLGDVYAPQVVQHNSFDFGQIVNNGIGLFMNSLDAATSSVEANRFDIQNIYQSWINVQLDDATHNASTSNGFFIDAMDDSASNAVGGHGALIYGSFNRFEVTYLGTDFFFGSPQSSYNTVRTYNTTATGATYWGGGSHNTFSTAG